MMTSSTFHAGVQCGNIWKCRWRHNRERVYSLSTGQLFRRCWSDQLQGVYAMVRFARGQCCFESEVATLESINERMPRVTPEAHREQAEGS